MHAGENIDLFFSPKAHLATRNPNGCTRNTKGWRDQTLGKETDPTTNNIARNCLVNTNLQTNVKETQEQTQNVQATPGTKTQF